MNAYNRTVTEVSDNSRKPLCNWHELASGGRYQSVSQHRVWRGMQKGGVWFLWWLTVVL